jgi:hypothetical protein
MRSSNSAPAVDPASTKNSCLPASQLSTVSQTQIPRESLEVINLPMREVDCTTWEKDTTGALRRKNDSQSCLSSRAFRITSSYPVVAYQFNPIINDFSNGASLLIPTTGLDDDYLVLGWSTSKPSSVRRVCHSNSRGGCRNRRQDWAGAAKAKRALLSAPVSAR